MKQIGFSVLAIAALYTWLMPIRQFHSVQEGKYGYVQSFTNDWLEEREWGGMPIDTFGVLPEGSYYQYFLAGAKDTLWVRTAETGVHMYFDSYPAGTYLYDSQAVQLKCGGGVHEFVDETTSHPGLHEGEKIFVAPWENPRIWVNYSGPQQ